jgi:cytochrome c oxidase cbb3-type subunit 3
VSARWLVATSLLVLGACGGPESPGTVASNTDSGTPEQAIAHDPRTPPSVRYPQYPSAGNTLPPAVTLSNPMAADPAAVQAGESLFTAMNCDGCHGGGAIGFVGPSLVDGRWRYGGDDGAVFQSIFYGRPRGMPAYGGLLNDAVTWQLISYLRAQPQPDVVPTVAWVE